MNAPETAKANLRNLGSCQTAMAAGEVAGVTDDIASLTGDPATSLAELVRRGGTAY